MNIVNIIRVNLGSAAEPLIALESGRKAGHEGFTRVSASSGLVSSAIISASR